MQTPKYVTDAQLAERFCVSRATIWRWSVAGRLPRPVRLSPACTRWLLAEIEAHEAQRAAARDHRAA